MLRLPKDALFGCPDARRRLRRPHGGAVERVRPEMMTVVAIMASLLPIMWSAGTANLPRALLATEHR
jgi:hypothetical protein